MFDTMTMTKAVGGLCGSLLVLLLGAWVAEMVYFGDGHGKGAHKKGYAIDTGIQEDAGGAAEETSIFEMMAAADAEKGRKVFAKCKACHKVEDGVNGTGPHLYGIVGRAVGSVEGFNYSGALSEAAEAWTPETLNGFLAAPKRYAPGTSMAFVGLRKPEDRANVISYLDGLDGDVFEMEPPQ